MEKIHIGPFPSAAAFPKRRSKMLKLNRYVNQRVIIADEVIVEVLEIRKDSVKLGFQSPEGVDIWREEIWVERNRESKKKMAESNSTKT